VQEDAATRTAALLKEATEHNQASADRLEADIAEAARIRAEALNEAERAKLTAIKESEERVEAAKAQAAAITERTQSEFAWRKQELRRETELLGQRKQAVLNQLASLSALAQQTAQSFPEIDDLGEFQGEEGDRTILRPAGAGPALPESDDPREQTNGHASERKPETAEIDDDSPTERVDADVDGDATIVIPSGTVPSGTAHLKAEANDQQD
jgi:hypothetical protein